MKALSDPKSLTPPGTFNLRKPRLSNLKTPKFKVSKPAVKMISMAALAGPKKFR